MVKVFEMNMDYFVKKVKEAKLINRQTGFFDVKARASSDKKIWFLFRKEKCSKCGHEKKEEVIAWFKEPMKLTIFQAEMLFSVFGIGRRPLDYANYHKCQAGKEFIESMEDIAKNVIE